MYRAFAGALGFLSRLPVGRDERDWEAFRRTPAAFPMAGYVVGALVAVPVALPLPPPVVAALLPVAIYGITGINHVDGLADLGDAAAVHGADGRRAAMKDTQVGVGGVLAVGLVVAGLSLAGLGLASLPARRAVATVVAAEVGAKLGMAALAVLGTPAHEGLGARIVGQSGRGFVPAAVVGLPAVALTWPAPVGAVVVGSAVVVALAVGWWARRWLGGVSGDVLGAANELARLAALHVGVVAWTLS